MDAQPTGGGAAAVLVRATEPGDIAAVTEIYAHHVLHGVATFETEPPGVAEMQRRREAVLGARMPWLVASVGGVVVGYAYAGPFRARAAYAGTVEDSVYLHPQWAGRGIGRALLGELIRQCTAAGFAQMIALIGDSANERSIRLHRSLGFGDVGVLTAVGYKHERWVDVVLMQRALGGKSGG